MLPNVDSIAARLRLKQLRLLIALDDHGSLHRAADEMSLTQPGATKALREIESTFGATLFVRSAQGIRPNELGRCVIRYARLIHMDVAHLRVDVHLATILRWMQRFVPEFEKRWNRFAGKAGRSHRLKASPPYLATPDTHRSTGLRSNASGTSVPASGRHE